MKISFKQGRRARSGGLFSPLLLILLSLPCVSGAQTAPPGRPALESSVSGMAAGAGNLARLLDQLQLSPVQMPLWQAYSDRVAAYTRLYYEEKPATAYTGDNGARQVGRLVDLLQNRLAALEEIEGAARALYAALNATQKKLADNRLLETIPVFNAVGIVSCPATETSPRGGRNEGGRGPGGGMGAGGGMGGMSGNMGGPGGL